MASLIRYAASPEVTPIGSVASLLRLGGSLRRCAADASDGVVRGLALRCYWSAQLALISEPPSQLGRSLATASIGAAIQVVMSHRLPAALTPTPPAALSAAVQAAVLAATAAGRPLPAARPPLLPPPPSASSMLRFSGSSMSAPGSSMSAPGSSMSAPGSSMSAAHPAPLEVRQGREIAGDAICAPPGPTRPPPPPPAAANPVKSAPTGSAVSGAPGVASGAVSGAPSDHAHDGAPRSPPQRPRAAQCAQGDAVSGAHDGASSPPAASLPQRPRSAQPTINRHPLGGGLGAGADEDDGTHRFAPAPSALISALGRPSRPPSAPSRSRSSSRGGCHRSDEMSADGTSDVQRLEIRHEIRQAAPEDDLEDDLGPSSHDLGRDLVGARGRTSASSHELAQSPTHLASSEGRRTGHAFPLKGRPVRRLTASSTAGGGWQQPYRYPTAAQHGARGARSSSAQHLTRSRSCGGALRSSTSAVGYLVDGARDGARDGGGHRAEGAVAGAAGAGAGSAVAGGGAGAAHDGARGGWISLVAERPHVAAATAATAAAAGAARAAPAAQNNAPAAAKGPSGAVVGAARLVVTGNAAPPKTTPKTAPMSMSEAPRTAPRDPVPRTAPPMPRTAPPHAEPHRIVPYTGLVPRTAPPVPPAPPLHETTHVYLPLHETTHVYLPHHHDVELRPSVSSHIRR